MTQDSVGATIGRPFGSWVNGIGIIKSISGLIIDTFDLFIFSVYICTWKGGQVVRPYRIPK